MLVLARDMHRVLDGLLYIFDSAREGCTGEFERKTRGEVEEGGRRMEGGGWKEDEWEEGVKKKKI
jgi:hypothetical protein